MTQSHTIETLSALYLEQNTDPMTDGRRASLGRALEIEASDASLVTLVEARRVSQEETIVLPAHRYEGLSRGKGWARKGRGPNAVWGERDDGGYRVGPGKWTVGGNDGFSRKGAVTWDVKHVQVGGETWTVAS